jgi:hypothetical protein
MLFGGRQTREEIIEVLSSDRAALDNVIAMANVGAAFSQVCILEDSVGVLLLTSQVTLQQKLDPDALTESGLFLERLKQIRASTLGRLVTAIEKSGVIGRDIRYLRAIVELRNDFVHRLTKQVPLPGDWGRYGFTGEQFSGYTRYVLRHLCAATHYFPRIMVRHGLLAGQFGDFGGMLWNPDDPFLRAWSDDETKRD